MNQIIIFYILGHNIGSKHYFHNISHLRHQTSTIISRKTEMIYTAACNCFSQDSKELYKGANRKNTM